MPAATLMIHATTSEAVKVQNLAPDSAVTVASRHALARAASAWRSIRGERGIRNATAALACVLPSAMATFPQAGRTRTSP